MLPSTPHDSPTNLTFGLEGELSPPAVHTPLLANWQRRSALETASLLGKSGRKYEDSCR